MRISPNSACLSLAQNSLDRDDTRLLTGNDVNHLIHSLAILGSQLVVEWSEGYGLDLSRVACIHGVPDILFTARLLAQCADNILAEQKV
jgi:hypothetical protein